MYNTKEKEKPINEIKHVKFGRGENGGKIELTLPTSSSIRYLKPPLSDKSWLETCQKIGNWQAIHSSDINTLKNSQKFGHFSTRMKGLSNFRLQKSRIAISDNDVEDFLEEIREKLNFGKVLKHLKVCFITKVTCGG